MMRRCAFYTFGCKVNQYETEVLREAFARRGIFEYAPRPDVIVVNGCALTSVAERECRRLLGVLRNKHKTALIILTGCAAAVLKNSALIPQTRAVIVPQALKERIPALVSAKKIQNIPLDSRLCRHNVNINSRLGSFRAHARAFVKIQDGCAQYCSYCIVPYMRGAPRSKDLRVIIREVRQLIRRGFREIVLTGIDLGSWGRDLKPKQTLSEAIAALAAIKPLERLRLSSIELRHVTPRLIGLFKDSAKICPHLHIPLQSADDTILRRMNRNYTAAEYRNTVRLIKKSLNEVSLTTDVIAGFPGEREEHFQRTADYVREIGFSRVHVFPFSPRPGTKAALFSGQVLPEVIKERAAKLRRTAAEVSYAYRKKLAGKIVNVLFEAQKQGYWQGYTGTYVSVRVRTKTNPVNRIMPVKITRVTKDAVIGSLS